MLIGHITQTGNISIPKKWRDELGIGPNSSVMIEKKEDKIIIEPLKRKTLKGAFSVIDEEMKRKKISFTRPEAVKDDLYD